jgi:hypothetical protein
MPVILFLDFDGVLHSEHCHDSLWFSQMHHFESAVRGTPDTQVVVSSTWRHQHTLEALKNHFSEDIAALMVGVTPRYEQLVDVPERLVNYPREAECQAWLEQSGTGRWAAWIAVDDRSWGFRPFNKNVLLINGETGMQEEDSIALRRLIAERA